MMSRQQHYDAIIAGAGPAGSSAAIHLAKKNFSVLLLEQKRFPRPKLCGEFISPECTRHFATLGVDLEMQSSGPAQITETVFYSQAGKGMVVPSRWFGGTVALGLSRAVMDDNLLRRAKDLGVDVREGAIVSDLIQDSAGVHGVSVRSDSSEEEYYARVILDATGRARSLVRKVKPTGSRRPTKPKLVAFKTHLLGAHGAAKACEIYSYPGGYGGLSTVENGFSNLCFIVEASEVMRARSDPAMVMRNNVMRNRRAAFTLGQATIATDWLSVSLERFGRQSASPVNGLLSIGDAAAFIDPFTGSGMLMALESGELVAKVIVRHADKLDKAEGVGILCSNFAAEYRRKFDSRLRISGVVRQLAYKPALAQLAIEVCGSSERFRSWLARATRSSSRKHAARAGLT